MRAFRFALVLPLMMMVSSCATRRAPAKQKLQPDPISANSCRVVLVLQTPTREAVPIHATPEGPVLFTDNWWEAETFRTVSVIGYEKGWWKIDTTLLESAPRMIPNGGWPSDPLIQGWIRVSHTFFAIGDMETGRMTGGRYSTPIYTGPTYAKKSGVRVHEDAEIEFVGCHGPWVKISHRFEGVHTLGWWAPEDQCPNMVTNCHKSEEGEMTGIDSDGNR
jgi:hypothetical protein